MASEKPVTDTADESAEQLFQRVSAIWQAAKGQTARSVNSTLVQANWMIGQQVVEVEQAGESRAGYGKQVIEALSRRMNKQFGRGFSVSSIRYLRAFYLAYPQLLADHDAGKELADFSVGELASEVSPPIHHAVRGELGQRRNRVGNLNPALSWTHYRALLGVDRIEARNYYELEASSQGWSARELERQIAPLSYDRLLSSRASQQEPADTTAACLINPRDVIRDPYVLEFLDLPEPATYQESDLEAALLSQLQAFLLELGQGFAFVGRQVRISLEGDHFYPDLVFYHIKLKCYVVVELKLGKLNHADLGQMQLYVHYYDREVREADDNPTVGLILCSEKNDAVVRYVLDEEQQQIFASRYQLHMPTEEQLQQEIQREKALLESLREKQS